ncbi:TPA: sodium:proton antiporter [Burkholderia cepacia ATCC 25416]|uniref:Sodium:proton antiporter n=1 Tax=Burkholderia cenocepacia TaxID=95486 RepID=A0ABD4U4W7_9BURK|nr:MULTISPECIES: sodium:proton antiporter [Burkholderia cepacia complex]HDR9769732.1 sodium:proton antiporter [Burkholderia cepacia ATCC 25416]KVE77506.1 sodium:proton antiporter [Burkholderia cepacia]MCA8078957.1 sodium:proton antiporter [Burkholderia cepacia]MCW3694306.1 sodium:proton antiporter [Burkholderia cenocepacia]MCW3702467.1 sodium:proton antiporter [Burkholderia cenocepacia]
MTFFHALTALIVLAALGSYVNHRVFHLPPTIGVMTIALVATVLLVILGEFGAIDVTRFTRLIPEIDFSELLFHGFLPFLLFAGALHVDLHDLRQVKWTVGVLSTVGTLISTMFVGTVFWYASWWLGVRIGFIYALLFGALISPTDPIAVMSIIKKAGAPRELETRITGESLFNDGVGAIVFLTLLSITTAAREPGVFDVTLLFIQQAVGGALAGWLAGWIVSRLVASIDNHHVEILLSIALCMGSYALAELGRASGPIAVVVAGLFAGNHGTMKTVSGQTGEYLSMFWEIVDEMMNSVLFLLIGLEVLSIHQSRTYLIAGMVAVGCVLAGRTVSVAIPLGVIGLRIRFPKGTTRLLIWGGLRGAISLALALLLPHGPQRELIVTVTYVVVVFSVLTQGTTFGWLLRKLTSPPEPTITAP